MNRAILTGNLGADPELRFTQGGKAVLNMRIATTETWMVDGEKNERTDWHNAVVWGPRAEALDKILSKGSKVLIDGPIRNSSYEDRDGVKKYKSEIEVRELELLSPAPGGARRDEEDEPRSTRERGRSERDTRGPRAAERSAPRGRDERRAPSRNESHADDDIPF